jgi:hypothetical protein
MASEADPKPPPDPRYELVFEPELLRNEPRQTSNDRRQRPRPRGSFAGVLRELSELRERGGAALGDAYARAAKSFLDRWESFEDKAAERRYRQRAQRPQTKPSAAKPAPRPAATSPSTK